MYKCFKQKLKLCVFHPGVLSNLIIILQSFRLNTPVLLIYLTVLLATCFDLSHGHHQAIYIKNTDLQHAKSKLWDPTHRRSKHVGVIPKVF
jgi:hypothetical protein